MSETQETLCDTHTQTGIRTWLYLLRKKGTFLKDLAIALSLSNLCFISAWRLLLTPSEFHTYHQRDPRPVIDYFALILDVIVLATMFFICAAIARHSDSRLVKKTAKVLLILFSSAALYGVLSQIVNPAAHQIVLSTIGDEVVVRRLLFSISLTVCLFILLLSMWRIDRAAKIAAAFVLILTPLVPITFSQSVVTAIRQRPGHREALNPMAKKAERSPTRVLWLIFDEFDFRTAFERRPSGLELPGLDRLAGESLFARNAYPPAGETFLTMPALLTGRLVSEARRKGTDELMIKFNQGTKPVPWSAQPNIFTKTRDLGFNTALVGWYHPYCRILGESLTKCGWEDGLLVTAGEGITPYMYAHVRQNSLVSPFAPLINKQIDVPALVRRKQISDFESIYSQAVDAATNPDFAVVMVHWPIPHHPNIYDRANQRISESPGHSYLDNLALVDRTLTDLRRAMESKGVWESTVVLISSDHWWRGQAMWKRYRTWTPEDEKASEGEVDRRVPFILKLAGHSEATEFSAPFNTVLTHDLLLAVLRGEIKDTPAAVDWLNRHRSIGRSPYDELRSR